MDTAPEPAMPDTRDWTFVLDGGCPECGYTLHDPATTGQRLRAGVPRWQAVLRRPNVAERPAPRVWSTLEYASHARDLIAVLGQRVRAMITEDTPTFADYDGEAEAIRRRFWAADPAAVAQQIASRTDETVKIVEGVEDWWRDGLRSDGRRFTVAQLCQYLLHDVEHHLHDVAG
ncbi:DinB family protein [Rhodococcus aetherivorans]|uniref:DinB family protein n=1 Tax=Rhodococcus aetherivorans TaxID=191292 RepID=UPI0031DDD916